MHKFFDANLAHWIGALTPIQCGHAYEGGYPLSPGIMYSALDLPFLEVAHLTISKQLISQHRQLGQKKHPLSRRHFERLDAAL